MERPIRSTAFFEVDEPEDARSRVAELVAVWIADVWEANFTAPAEVVCGDDD